MTRPALAAWPKDEFYEILTGPLRLLVPHFLARVEMPAYWLETRALPAPYGLKNLADEQFPLALPSACAIVQAVVRHGTAYYYDPFVIDLLRADREIDQLSLLRLHEALAQIYFEHDPGSVALSRTLFLRYVEFLAAAGHGQGKNLPESLLVEFALQLRAFYAPFSADRLLKNFIDRYIDQLRSEDSAN